MALGALYVWRTAGASYEIAVENVAHETQLVALEFKSAYNELQNDAFVISRTPPIEGILRSVANNDVDPMDGSSTAAWRNRLETIFASVMDERKSYTQIRYIGMQNKGRELVRVNRTADGFERVPERDLQSKAQEVYFRKSLGLRPGEVYFSKVSYNRELGKIDDELVPTIRVVVPVFDSAGAIFGMIVINADYRLMLRDRFELIGLKRNIIVTNQAGDYMEQKADGTIEDFHFTQNRGGGGDVALFSDFRDSKDSGLRSWVRKTSSDLVYSVRMPISYHLDDSHLVMSIRVPNNELFANARRARNEGILLSLFLMMVSVGGGWWAATRLTQPLLNMTRSLRQASRTGVMPDLPVERSDEIGELAAAFQGLAEELTGSEDQIRAIFDNVVDGVLTIDADGVIQNYSPSCEQIFGYSIGEAIGQDIGLLLSDTLYTQYDALRHESEKTGPVKTIGVTREIQGIRRDGSAFPLEISMRRVEIGEQRIFVSIVRDITERKQMEILKDEFVSTVNHELRTPLTSIQASLGILQKILNGKVDAKAQRLIDISSQSTQRLGLLVNDILDIEKIAAGKMEFHAETCEMVGLVRDIIERHQSLAEKYNVRFIMKANVSETYCRVDPSRFNQALVNMLSNAAKFSPQGETVEIELEEQDGRQVRVSVSDHGPGIPASFREKIFQRFAQADSSATRAAGGSGLGLAITKSIIEALDGEISFESVEGEGTTFMVVFPTVSPSDQSGKDKCQVA
jgi:PAS domain S-box-containing protein